MQWPEIRRHAPAQWLRVEAPEARSESNERVIEQMAVLETFNDFEIEVGGMDYGFAIDGIIGLDFLLAVRAIVDLDQLQLFPPAL